MKIKGIFDDAKSLDRYTVVYDYVENYTAQGKPLYAAVGMNAAPFHPQGIGQHCTAMLGRHLGKKIKFTDLPEDCQKLVQQDLKEN